MHGCRYIYIYIYIFLQALQAFLYLDNGSDTNREESDFDKCVLCRNHLRILRYIYIYIYIYRCV